MLTNDDELVESRFRHAFAVAQYHELIIDACVREEEYVYSFVV